MSAIMAIKKDRWGFRFWLLVACSLFVLAGCKKCTVTGKITRGGQPLQWKTDEGMLLVIFAPQDRQKNKDIYRAESDSKEGTYTLKAIPSGTYLVSIQLMDPPPLRDELQFAYGLNNSPLEYQVSGDMEINIDLPKEGPKKGKSGSKEN